MRRYALLAPIGRLALLLACTQLLGACEGSGFWRYERDTFTLPGANPNRPVGSSENFMRARHGTVNEPQPILTEAGDIWPGPPQPVPTLKDLQKQQTAELNANGTPGIGAGVVGLAPLPALPSLPGFEVTQQDPATPVPQHVFPGAVPTRGGRLPLEGNQSYKGGTAPGSNIVVPNGNGTSTVISPNGTVSTIPTPK